MSTTYTSTLIYGLHIDDIGNISEDKAGVFAEQLGLKYHYNGNSYIGINLFEISEDDDDAQPLEHFLTKANKAAKLFKEKLSKDGMLIMIINSY